MTGAAAAGESRTHERAARASDSRPRVEAPSQCHVTTSAREASFAPSGGRNESWRPGPTRRGGNQTRRGAKSTFRLSLSLPSCLSSKALARRARSFSSRGYSATAKTKKWFLASPRRTAAWPQSCELCARMRGRAQEQDDNKKGHKGTNTNNNNPRVLMKQLFIWPTRAKTKSALSAIQINGGRDFHRGRRAKGLRCPLPSPLQVGTKLGASSRFRVSGGARDRLARSEGLLPAAPCSGGGAHSKLEQQASPSILCRFSPPLSRQTKSVY